MAKSKNTPVKDWPLEMGRPAREVWYGFATAPERPLALWYRYTLLSTSGDYQEARCWAAVTDRNGDLSTFGTHRIPLHDADILRAPFGIEFGAAGTISDDRVTGTVDTAESHVEWDLHHDPDTLTFSPVRSRAVTDLASKFLGTGKHWSVNQSVRVSGTIRVGDEEFELTDAPGHQGHTVGKTPPDRWRWVHCNDFGVDGLAIEALDLGGKLSICLRTPDGPYLLNRLVDLVGPWANQTIEASPGVWEFKTTGEQAQIQCRMEADPDHWQRVAYKCPDGSLRYNAHCSVTRLLLRCRTWESGGWTQWPDAKSTTARAEWVDIAPPVPGEYGPDDWDGGVQ